MTDAGCAKDKCCRAKHCWAMEARHMEDDCRNYVPTMEFAGFGRAYVPQQRLCELFSAKEGFIAGTIFPELYIPYEGRLNSQNLENEEGESFE